ncbi:MAG: class I SAM-dependent methyltransferase [Pyrinomonadaceae bacterium]
MRCTKHLAHWRHFNLESYLAPLRAMSVHVAKEWTNGPLSPIFIDANHTYEGLMSDLLAWTPRVTKGGIICGDDWEFTGDGDFKNVQAAVTDFVTRNPEYKLEIPCYNTWSMRIK